MQGGLLLGMDHARRPPAQNVMGCAAGSELASSSTQAASQASQARGLAATALPQTSITMSMCCCIIGSSRLDDWITDAMTGLTNEGGRRNSATLTFCLETA